LEKTAQESWRHNWRWWFQLRKRTRRI